MTNRLSVKVNWEELPQDVQLLGYHIERLHRRITESDAECKFTNSIFEYLYPEGIAACSFPTGNKRRDSRATTQRPTRWYAGLGSLEPSEEDVVCERIFHLLTFRMETSIHDHFSQVLNERWSTQKHSFQKSIVGTRDDVDKPRKFLIKLVAKVLAQRDALDEKEVRRIKTLLEEFRPVLEARRCLLLSEKRAQEKLQAEQEQRDREARQQERLQLAREQEYREAEEAELAKARREAAERQRQLEEERQKHAAEMERQRIQREHEQRQNQQWLANNLHRYNMKLERQTRWDALMAEKRSEAEFMPFTPAESDIREAAEYEYNVWLNANPQFNTPDPDPAWMQMKGY